MDKIRTIVGKEWSEVFKNKLVLFTVLFLPLILAILPIGMLFSFNQAGDTPGFQAEMSDPEIVALAGEMCAGLSPVDCTIVYLLNVFVLLFMILPVSIPVTIAAYSIVGEKATRSLEPLLATPITTVELLVAKLVAAIVPAILATWLAFGIFLVGARLLTTPVIFGQFFAVHWLIAIFAVTPLLTLFSGCVAVIISSRVTDPRVAEQLASVVVLPLVLLVIGQAVGLILINRQVMLLLGLIVLVLDVALVYLSVRLFQRETILTRWK